MPDVESKPWYQSKQIWLGLLGTAVEVGQYALDLKMVPPGGVGAAIGIGTILLRRYSQSDPVHFVTPRVSPPKDRP